MTPIPDTPETQEKGDRCFCGHSRSAHLHLCSECADCPCEIYQVCSRCRGTDRDLKPETQETRQEQPDCCYKHALEWSLCQPREPVDGGHCKREHGHADECSLKRRPLPAHDAPPRAYMTCFGPNGCRNEATHGKYCEHHRDFDRILREQTVILREIGAAPEVVALAESVSTAHDAPQVERFTVGAESEWPDKNGSWVRWETAAALCKQLEQQADFLFRAGKERATLEAEKQQLERSHDLLDEKYGSAVDDLDNALKSLASLREAVRESDSTIYIVESGEYENHGVELIAATLESAYQAATAYSDPYIVKWSELKDEGEYGWSFTGEFEAVYGYSTKHTHYATIRKAELVGGKVLRALVLTPQGEK